MILWLCIYGDWIGYTRFVTWAQGSGTLRQDVLHVRSRARLGASIFMRSTASADVTEDTRETSCINSCTVVSRNVDVDNSTTNLKNSDTPEKTQTYLIFTIEDLRKKEKEGLLTSLVMPGLECDQI